MKTAFYVLPEDQQLAQVLLNHCNRYGDLANEALLSGRVAEAKEWGERHSEVMKDIKQLVKKREIADGRKNDNITFYIEKMVIQNATPKEREQAQIYELLAHLKGCLPAQQYKKIEGKIMNGK